MQGTGKNTGRGEVPTDDSDQPSMGGGTGGPGEDFADDPERVAQAAREPQSPPSQKS
jgi:hypothetical protein